MKNNFKLLLLLILILFCFIFHNRAIYSQYSISGHVFYSDNHSTVVAGNVYLISFSLYSGITTVLGSTALNENGSYALETFTNDSILVCTGWLPEVEEEDHVLTFYPSTVNWVNAQKVYPPDNPVNINIYVQRILPLQNKMYISGTVTSLDSNSNPVPLSGATVIAVKDSYFRSLAVTDASGNYVLDSLDDGTYNILCEKIGFEQDSVTISLDGDNFSLSHLSMRMDKTLLNKTRDENKLAGHFLLNQNYPNPFNPYTKIKFTVPGSKENENFVGLAVYDISGKLVKTLVSRLMTSGTYEITWDASVNSSGVYFYELNCAGYKLTKKMILLK